MHVQQQQPQQATSRPFNLRLANIVGVLLIVLGSVGILFNFIDLGAGTSTDEVRHIDSHYTNKQGSGDRWLSELSLGVAVHGVWCGILFIVTGSIALSLRSSFTTCKFNAFLVLTIVGAVFGLIQLVIAAVGASAVDSEVQKRFGVKIVDAECDLLFIICHQVKLVYAMEILLAVLGAGAIGVNLFGLVLCLLAKGWVRNPFQGGGAPRQ